MKSRLFIVSGPSQLLFLGAVFSEKSNLKSNDYFDILILRGDNVSDRRKDITEKIAKSILNWNKIIWFDNAEYFSQKNKNSFLKKIIKEDVREIWLCMPFAPVELNFRRLFYSAKVMFFDDGLGSCVRPISFSDFIKKPSFIKKSAALNFSKYLRWFRAVLVLKVCGLPSKGIEREYLLFSDFLNKNKRNTNSIIIDWQKLKNVVELIKVNSQFLLDFPETTKCLVIGQFFSSNEAINREDELAEYHSICETMIAKGYTVIWKEHPKNPKPFFGNLKEYFGSNLYNLDDYYSFHWPIEVLLNNFEVDLCVSCTSTSLITINKLFGSEILSFSPRFTPKLRGSDREVAVLLTEKLQESELIY